jgi:catechol 2,3-dioxygenase-like lactoylglutathione lyase family enzyme
LAIEGWRVGVVVKDLERAVEIYRALGADVVGKDDLADDARCRIRLGANTTVELIKPRTEDTLAGIDLASNGEIMHSCIFETSNLASAEAHLAEHGVDIAERGSERFITNPSTCHGAVFEFVAVEKGTNV